MGHSHPHAHNHHGNKKSLVISLILITSFMVIEFIGGFLTNSLALISDAGHMLSDAVALGLSLLAFKIGEKASSTSKTYGYRRLEILVAFINGVTLVLISIYIFTEAYQRFYDPPNVSPSMMIVAIIGLIINIIVAWILMRGDTENNLNMKSALLHVFGDLLGSIGAIIAGVLIIMFGWHVADPIASVVVASLILVSAWRVTKDSFHVLMEGKPIGLDLKNMQEDLLQISGVKSIHDLHVWLITSDFPALSCHIVVEDSVDRDKLLYRVRQLLQENYAVKHTTIQMEGENSNIHDLENNCN